MKEKAKEFKKELKQKGYDLKDFSIRTRYNEMIVKIKNYKVNKSEIEKIAFKYERVDYDEKLGEILAGGNDFVWVEYDVDFSQIYEDYKDKALELIEKLNEEIATRRNWAIEINKKYYLNKLNDFEYRVLILNNEGQYERENVTFYANSKNLLALCKVLCAIELFDNMKHFN